MEAFSTYFIIVSVVYVIYYLALFYYISKHHPWTRSFEQVFGYHTKYVIENPLMDGTFCVTDEKLDSYPITEEVPSGEDVDLVSVDSPESVPDSLKNKESLEECFDDTLKTEGHDIASYYQQSISSENYLLALQLPLPKKVRIKRIH